MWKEAHEAPFMPVLMNRNQNMASRDEDKSMISRVQTNISRRLMYIKQWERIPNAWVRQLSGNYWKLSLHLARKT